MPNIINVKHVSSQSFISPILMNLTLTAPINSTVMVYFGDKLVKTQNISTTGVFTTHLSIPLERPSRNTETIYYSILLNSQNVTTDYLWGNFSVTNKTGIVLSIQLITIMSLALIVVFVTYVNKITKRG